MERRKSREGRRRRNLEQQRRHPKSKRRRRTAPANPNERRPARKALRLDAQANGRRRTTARQGACSRSAGKRTKRIETRPRPHSPRKRLRADTLKRILKELEGEGSIARNARRRYAPAGGLPEIAVLEITGQDPDGDLLARPQRWDEQEPPPRIVVV